MSTATTSIEWTDKTWNPVRGCSIVSPGCVNCYAMRQAHRFSGEGQAYHGLTKRTAAGPQWTGKVVCDEAKLLEPLSWRKPARVFVNSMSDLFHEAVPDQFIVDVFGVMALAHWHTFQVLTKRPARLRAFLSAGDHGIVRQFSAIQQCGGIGPRPMFAALSVKRRDGIEWTWPLPNVWLGVSCENQQTANERIPLLLETPAAIRWVSAEPLLGPIDFTLRGSRIPDWDEDWHYNVLSGEEWASPRDDSAERSQHLDWVVVGGESGAGARPFDLAWGRSIVQQCQAAGVPVFVKQIGSFPRFDRDESQPFIRNRKGGDPSEWPEDLRVRAYPTVGPHQ